MKGGFQQGLESIKKEAKADKSDPIKQKYFCIIQQSGVEMEHT